MDLSARNKRNILFKVGYIDLFIFFLWITFSEYCRVTAPLVSNPSIGRIYEKNYHGSIVYLNAMENFILIFLLGLGLFIFFLLLFIDKYAWAFLMKKHNKESCQNQSTETKG